MDWDKYQAAIYRAKRQILKPVIEVDEIKLDELFNIKEQKKAILENTKAFLENKPFNHALLWGARGTGKSSLIKAVFNEFKNNGLRILEINRQDLLDLPDIIDEIRLSKYHFIIYCDDFSFEKGDDSYKGLKPILEGSIEMPPKNVVVYVTSNRRHLVSELFSDNEGVIIKNQEIHHGDAIEEKISLSDRFGLWISFYQGSLSEYIKIIEFLYKKENLNKDEFELIKTEAIRFADLRASRSARTAKQFYKFYHDRFI